MALRVSGKNLDIGETLRAQVEQRVASALAKYFTGSYTGHVTVARDGTGFRTECVLHLASGITLEASGSAHDAYASFEQGAERIEKRLRRYKRRLKDRAGPAQGANTRAGTLESAYAVIEAPSDQALDSGEYSPVIVADSTKVLHRYTVSEAVVELDLSGAPALVFIHAGSGRLNVLYRRHDGAIGWIDPPAGTA